MEQECPAIDTHAWCESGEIRCSEESALVHTCGRRPNCSPKGQTPVTMAVGGTRQKLSMVSSVTNQGKASWMIVDGAFNHERLIEFFEALVADGQRARKKVFLILDNLGVHHCKPVKAWLAQRSDRIEVFNLPATAGS